MAEIMMQLIHHIDRCLISPTILLQAGNCARRAGGMDAEILVSAIVKDAAPHCATLAATAHHAPAAA